MRKIIAPSLLAAALIAGSPAQAAVIIGGFTLDTGTFGTGQGVHSNGTQTGNVLYGNVNQDGSAVTFTSSDTIGITGSGQATVQSDVNKGTFTDLLVEFEKSWGKITFALTGVDGTFNLLVNGVALFDTGNCSICVIQNGETKFILSGAGIDTLDFTFDPAVSTAKQFRVLEIGQPIPEPATWAMMIAGLAFAGGMLRRRATKVQFA